MNLNRPPTSNRTVRVRFGDREIVAEGASRPLFADISHRCMTASWPAFIAGAAVIFLLFNAIFAALYWIGDQPVANVPGGAYIDYLYFSIETLSTAGYGDMHPQTHYGHFIATVELFTGVFSMSLMTGLIFARFSRPRPRFLFSDHPVITTRNGKPTLMIRFANERHDAVLHATARLWSISTESSEEGHFFRRFVELPLERSESPMLALTWTIIHVIDERSPLFGKTIADFETEKLSLILLVTGFDENAAQDIHARKNYRYSDVMHGRHYTDIISVDDAGRTLIDYHHFHTTTPDG
jgi:inward rectifier potassium channel